MWNGYLTLTLRFGVVDLVRTGMIDQAPPQRETEPTLAAAAKCDRYAMDMNRFFAEK